MSHDDLDVTTDVLSLLASVAGLCERVLARADHPNLRLRRLRQLAFAFDCELLLYRDELAAPDAVQLHLDRLLARDDPAAAHS